MTDRDSTRLEGERQVELVYPQGDIDAFPSEEKAAELEPPTTSPIPSASADVDVEHSDIEIAVPAPEMRMFLAGPPAADPKSGSAGRLRYRAIFLVALLGAASGFLLARQSQQWPWMRPDPVVRAVQGNTPEKRGGGKNASQASQGDDKADKPAPDPSVTQTVPETPNPDGQSTPADAIRPPNVEKPTRADSVEASAASHPSERDLSGWWSVTNRVESTAYAPFENLNLGYRLKLTHQGARISGSGLKWMENGRPLPPAQRTPIDVDGVVEEGRVVLRFTEYGTSRTSSGQFTYAISDPGVLQGTFVSDAADSKGSSRARRMPAAE